MNGMAQGADFRQFGEANLWYLTDQKRADKQSALFGEVSYAFTHQLTTTFGARWFENESTLNGVSGYGLIFPGSPILNVDSKDDDSDSIFKFNQSINLTIKKWSILRGQKVIAPVA